MSGIMILCLSEPRIGSLVCLGLGRHGESSIQLWVRHLSSGGLDSIQYEGIGSSTRMLGKRKKSYDSPQVRVALSVSDLPFVEPNVTDIGFAFYSAGVFAFDSLFEEPMTGQ